MRDTNTIAAEPESAASPFRPRVLLVEDSLTNQEFVREFLSPYAAAFTITNNGFEGVDAFRYGTFDIVLMDIQMPMMNGLDATRAIRALEREQNRPRTPVVMYSSNATKTDIQNALDAGCDTYIVKPVSEEVLVSRIGTILGKSLTA